MSKIILVNGKKRSGKDYFAKLLQEELLLNGATSEILHFADPIKDMISITLGISLEELEALKNAETELYILENNSPKMITDFRILLQKFGTGAAKKWFGDSVWVDLLLKSAEDITADYVIVPDFRFKIELISDTTVRIKNMSVDNSTDTHISETELNNFIFEYEIDNTDYADLSSEVSEFTSNLLNS